MRLFEAEGIRTLDRITIETEPIASIDLMERAGKACTVALEEHIKKTSGILIICGTGNNGGDGLVIARHLNQNGYEVDVMVADFGNRWSEDFTANFKRVKSDGKVNVTMIRDISALPEADVLIDAVFGSGLSRPPEGDFARLIERMNQHAGYRISIDIPSGMPCEPWTFPLKSESSTIFRSHLVLTLELPKLSFFFPSASPFLDSFEVVPIGLSENAKLNTPSPYYLTEEPDAISWYRPARPFDHKGSRGHLLSIAGSAGMAGAAILSGRAAFRMGTGLVTLSVPDVLNEIIQTSLPEAMVHLTRGNDHRFEMPGNGKYTAVLVGPGLGREDVSAKGMTALLEELSTRKIPVIIDADGLNLVSEIGIDHFEDLLDNAILTPHPGEFDRMAGRSESHAERWLKAKELSVKLNTVIVLKGHFTTVFLSNGDAWFNSTGNEGMATAGSGDTLSGIIGSLLAQGYETSVAARFGVWLHGKSGDLAADNTGKEGLMASDIIESLKNAFEYLNEKI